MNCKFCGKPVVLSPSAQERSEKYGKPKEYYIKLFDSHSSCEISNRNKLLSSTLSNIKNRV